MFTTTFWSWRRTQISPNNLLNCHPWLQALERKHFVVFIRELHIRAVDILDAGRRLVRGNVIGETGKYATIMVLEIVDSSDPAGFLILHRNEKAIVM